MVVYKKCLQKWSFFKYLSCEISCQKEQKLKKTNKIGSSAGNYGPGSSVGITTDFGLDGPGSNPGGDEIFCSSRSALGPTQPPLQWVSGLSRG